MPRLKKIALTRRGFLSATALAAAGSAMGAPAAKRPNVIFAFSDEHRWCSMGHTEMPSLQTPTMDRMAREGFSFTHTISNYPVCTPYRGLLMTGLWPFQSGLTDNGLEIHPEKQTTLGQAFKDAGYRTGYVGKWHLGGVRAEASGFDTSLIWTGDNTHWDKAEYHPKEGPPVRPKGYNATLMTDQALDFIGDGAGAPFFLMLSWNPPHSNFLDSPEAKKALYPLDSLAWRGNVPESIKRTEKSGDEGWKSAGPPYYQGYHAHISAIDDELNRVLAHLDAHGLAENTIVVYSSDHGSMMGSHALGGKRQPFEESIRIPFIARCPGRIPANAHSDALIGAVDFMPTLCGLAGVPVPAHGKGQDFSPWLEDGAGPDPDAQCIMHIAKENASGGENHPAPLFRGLRTRRHTYVVLQVGGELLFDDTADPLQEKNLAQEASLDGLRAELRKQLAEALRRADDPFPIS